MTIASNRAVVKGSGGVSAYGPGAVANSGVISHLHLTSRPAQDSGYLLQVEALAAADFQGREDELAALSSFCTVGGPEEVSGGGRGYWRWLAPAWAGKSALLAKFVLDPPPGMDVVSFFITSRLARQNDAAAFCEVVQRQLSSLLQEEQPLTTPHTREEQLRLAMDRAARLCSERGRRLVLVVDGLDEDRGVKAGPDCHSIAAMLPRVLPHGMRVVVASRPHPPVPGDVPGGHPLRTAQIDHWLEPSAHAQVARWDAEQDLLRVLEDGGLGRELIGLTVAAGGGLSADDLAELSRSRPRLVERELSAVSGRSFQQRSAHWEAAAPNVYLLAHEEIQLRAVALLTDDEAAGYRRVLHQWADRYRDAGWPASTPEYLLRGYTQMLDEQGETERLVALACDAARHERLWQVTGADLAGLSEVAASLDQLLRASRQGRPNIAVVSTAVRLAAARDKLHDRMSQVPSNLIALWARLGHTARALSLARAQRDSFDRGSALASIAGILSRTGSLDEAKALAENAASPDDRDRCLEQIAKGIAQAAGQHGEALHAARGIEEAEPRAKALAAIAVAQAAATGQDGSGDGSGSGTTRCVAEAVAAVDQVDNEVTQAPLYGLLIAALSTSGHDHEARALAERVVSLEGWAGPGFRRAQLLAFLAQEMSSAPHLVPRAAALATASAELAAAIDDPDDVPWVFPHVAAALEATGQHAAAINLVERCLSDPDDIQDGLSEIAVAAAKAGDTDRALEIAEHLTAPTSRAYVLNTAGGALAKRGHTGRAAQLAEQSLQLIATEANLSWQVKPLAETAEVLHRAGDVEQALEVAAHATHLARDGVMSRHMADTLIEVATMLGRTGHADTGYRLARQAQEVAEAQSDDLARAMDLAKVAGGFHNVGHHTAGEELLHLLANEARRYPRRSHRASALQDVAVAHSRMGNPSRAKEIALKILDLQQTTQSPALRSWDRDCAAYAFIAAGDVDSAMELLGSLPEDSEPEVLSHVVAHLLTAGDPTRARDLAIRIADTNAGLHSLGLVAGHIAAAGDIDEALELSCTIPREASLPAIVKGIAAAGALNEARALADSITSPEHRSKALGCLAQGIGPTSEGRATLVEALSLGPWDQLIEEIADVAPEQLLLLCDVALQDA
ncbi:hypothetical protein [Streptomyces venezuelae]|uniref:tetratricopeptide repeat protein n=1 Tax=Streptomyces venezuelae TaxID=54571 RepID=UPI003646DE42